jgi:hypothetical protein
MRYKTLDSYLESVKVYHYEITLPNGGVFDTKYCYRSVLAALNRGRALKKEHNATKVRIEDNDTYKVYWIRADEA